MLNIYSTPATIFLIIYTIWRRYVDGYNKVVHDVGTLLNVKWFSHSFWQKFNQKKKKQQKITISHIALQENVNGKWILNENDNRSSTMTRKSGEMALFCCIWTKVKATLNEGFLLCFEEWEHILDIFLLFYTFYDFTFFYIFIFTFTVYFYLVLD